MKERVKTLSLDHTEKKDSMCDKKGEVELVYADNPALASPKAAAGARFGRPPLFM